VDMTTRVIQLVPEEFYHVYNRGTDKRAIFLDSADYQRFTELLFLSNSEHSIKVRDIKKSKHGVFDYDRGTPLVAIGAYCLMPNHFHLLVTPLVESGVSMFMGKLCTSYAMYFNKRYDRTGNLFQGRYKAQWADSDTYLKYLFSYIHLNPIKLIDATWREEGIKDAVRAYAFAASFQYSSLVDYIAMDGASESIVQTELSRPESHILNPKVFPTHLLTTDDRKKELFEWLTFNDFSNTQGCPG
jgi:putative transposase